jgi:hypothetical protein
METVNRPHLTLVRAEDAPAAANGAGPSPAEAVQGARAADMRAMAAARDGKFEAMGVALHEAERFAVRSQNRQVFLHHLVRAEAVHPLPERRAMIAQLAEGTEMARLLELHAADLLAAVNAARRRAQTQAPGGKMKWWNRPLILVVAAGITALVIFMGLTPPTPETAGMGPPARLASIALAIGKGVLVDPIVVTLSVALAFPPVRVILALLTTGLRIPAGQGCLFLLAVGVAVQVAKAVRITKDIRSARPGEVMLFAGRRRWLSYERPVKWVPLSLLLVMIAEAARAPTLAVIPNAFAFAGLAELVYRLLPLARPCLLVAERPDAPRQARIEVLGGLLRIQHTTFAIYELRAASLAPTSWWSPAQDIMLRKINGDEFRLEGFVTPTAARGLTDEINRLIREVPPLPFAGPSHHAAKHH